MAMGVYKIINLKNNNFYVGSAVNFSRRKSRHFSELRNNKHNNKHLQAAWNKYGETAFIFAIVEEINDKEAILSAENVWLKEHVGKEYCYNLGTNAIAPTLGWSGEKSPTWGRKRTPAELKAQSWKGRKHKDESKQKISNTLQGHKVSTETKLKISSKLQGEGNYWYGKKRPEHSIKVSKKVVAIAPDKSETIYDSITLLRETINLKAPTVNRAVKSEKPITRGPMIGWVFKYL